MNEKFNEQKIEEALKSYNAPVPSTEWKAIAKRNIINYAQQNSQQVQTSSQPNWSLGLLFSLGGILLIGFVGYSFYTLLMPGKVSDYEFLNESEKQEVLVKVLKNNSLETLNVEKKKFEDIANVIQTEEKNEIKNPNDDFSSPINQQSPRPITSDTFDQADSARKALTYRPDNFENTLRIYTNTTRYGKAYDNCYDFTKLENEYKSYEFFTKNGGVYTKNVHTVGGRLHDYGIRKYDTNINEFLAFKGGSYAVSLEYSERLVPVSYIGNPASYPVSYDNSPTNFLEDIKNYFGENVKVTDTVNIDGKTYYIVRGEYNFETDCANKIIYLYWVDSSSYNIVKYQTFINDESDEDNLMYETESKTELSKTNLESVLENFEISADFENVQIKKFNIENKQYNPEEYATKNIESLRQYFAQNNLTVFSLTGFNYSYTYSPLGNYIDPHYAYYRDRNFYPAGEFGDMLYKLNVYGQGYSDIISPYFYTASFYNSNTYAYIKSFTSSLDYKDIAINSMYRKIDLDNSIDINILVSDSRGDKYIDAKLYKTRESFNYSYDPVCTNNSTASYPTSFITSYPTSYSDSNVPVSYIPTSYPYTSPINTTYWGTEYAYDSKGCFIESSLIIFEYEGQSYSIVIYNSLKLDLSNLILEKLSSDAFDQSLETQYRY